MVHRSQRGRRKNKWHAVDPWGEVGTCPGNPSMWGEKGDAGRFPACLFCFDRLRSRQSSQIKRRACHAEQDSRSDRRVAVAGG